MKRVSKPLRAQADELFSRVIRQRDGACVRCGRVGDRLQCAHIVSRRYYATRWSEDNAWCLCLACHKFFTEHPLEWDEFVESRIGEDAYRQLKRRALAGAGRTDYKLLIVVLKDRLAKLAREEIGA